MYPIIDLKETLAIIEVRYIEEALANSNNVVAHAARLLGLKRTTLLMKLRKYKLHIYHGE